MADLSRQAMLKAVKERTVPLPAQATLDPVSYWGGVSEPDIEPSDIGTPLRSLGKRALMGAGALKILDLDALKLVQKARAAGILPERIYQFLVRHPKTVMVRSTPSTEGYEELAKGSSRHAAWPSYYKKSKTVVSPSQSLRDYGLDVDPEANMAHELIHAAEDLAGDLFEPNTKLRMRQNALDIVGAREQREALPLIASVLGRWQPGGGEKAQPLYRFYDYTSLMNELKDLPKRFPRPDITHAPNLSPSVYPKLGNIYEK